MYYKDEVNQRYETPSKSILFSQIKMTKFCHKDVWSLIGNSKKDAVFFTFTFLKAPKRKKNERK